MSRSHRDTTSSVSLFPFLAVLMCAMGALIFILLVTTHRLRQQAIARAEQERRKQTATPLPTDPVLPPLEPLPQPSQTSPITERPAPSPAVDPNIALRTEIDRLSRERDTLRENKNRRQQAVAALRNRQEAAKKSMMQARSQLTLIGHQQELERFAQHSLLKQKTGLSGQIRRADEQLKTIQQKNATAESRYAILPFDGKTGTTRRPILIECTHDGLQFIPENVTLTAKDLEEFTVGYNPLLAGSRSLIQYWSGSANSARTHPSLPRDGSGGRGNTPPQAKGPKPYVLLIVRPGGSISFYKARRFLARLGEPFGYELLETDHKLAVPPVDPDARAAVREAVDAVLAERTRLVATLGRGRGDGQGRTGEGRTGDGRGESGRGLRAGGRGDISRGRNGLSPTGHSSAGHSSNGRRRRGYQSGYGTRSGTGTIAEGQSGLRSPKTGGRWSESRLGKSQSGRAGSGRYRSGRTFGNGTRSNGITKQSTASSGQLGRHSAAGGQARQQQTAGQQITGQQQTGQQQTAGRQSAGSRGTRSGRTSASNAGRTAGGPTGSHVARGGNTPQPFPQFGQPHASGSQSPRMMRPSSRWGHAGSRRGIGFERNIPVAINADRITIGRRLIVPVGQGETRKQLIEQVAAAIDREARSWGAAPSGFYWVPNIQFAVHPGGNQYYERLNPTFRRWGLSTSARFPVGSSDDFRNGG